MVEEDAKEHKTIMRLSMRNNLPVSTTIVCVVVLVSSFLPCRSLSQKDGDTTENVYLKLQPPPSLT